MSGSTPDNESDDLTEKLLDLLVYAPIGLILDAQTLTPDLARRGRQHTAAARQLGEMAVKRSLRRFDDTASDRTKSTSTREPGRTEDTKTKSTATKKTAAKKTSSKKRAAKKTNSKTSTRTAKEPTADGKRPGPTDVARPDQGASGRAATTPSESAAGAASDTVAPEVESLAIPDYDLLAASQVVKRLDALTADELEAVRAYESGTRDRRTILHKIARLQA